MRLPRSHPGDLLFREPDHEQQSANEPARNRLDPGRDNLGLATRSTPDDFPEPFLGDAKLIAEHPMEQVLPDLRRLVVGDLRSQSGAVRKLPEIAPMITGPATPTGEVRLFGPSVVGDVPA